MTYPWSDWTLAIGLIFLFLLSPISSGSIDKGWSSSWGLLCLLFFLSNVLAFLRSSVPWEWALAGLCQGVQISLGAWLGFYLFDGVDGLRRVTCALLLATIYIGMDSYEQLHGGLDRMEEFVRLYRPDLTSREDLMSRLQDRAAFSTFFYPNSLAGFAAMVLWLGIGLVMSSESRTALFLPTAGTMAALYALFAAKSEGGYLALGFGIFFAISLVVSRWKANWRKGFLLTVLFCLILGCSLAHLLRTLDPFFLSVYRSTEIRIGYWLAAWNMILHHPFLGMGFGGFETYYADYAPSWAAYVRNPHSLPLQLWMERGVLGFICFLALAFKGLQGGMTWIGRLRNESRMRESFLVFGALVGIGSGLFHGLGEVDLSISGIMMPMAVLLGILFSEGRMKTQ